ncbi:hypothetical protein [Actinoplanes sp. HUAS TT8]|uniref:hypothetical protein n=1 Tax=Actinoplanes sp. HUAS TT8 TaxID=3447453 RepID=UPI003F527D50
MNTLTRAAAAAVIGLAAGATFAMSPAAAAPNCGGWNCVTHAADQAGQTASHAYDNASNYISHHTPQITAPDVHVHVGGGDTSSSGGDNTSSGDSTSDADSEYQAECDYYGDCD